MKVTVATGTALLLVLVSALWEPWTLLYALVPIGLAAGLVVLRGHPPLLAVVTGSLATFAFIVIMRLPVILIIAASNGFDTGDYCDGFCMSNEEGFIVAVILMVILAIPIAIAGGIVSAVASFSARRRPSHT